MPAGSCQPGRPKCLEALESHPFRILKSRVGLGLNGLEIDGFVMGEAPRAGLPVGLKRSQEVSRRQKTAARVCKVGSQHGLKAAQSAVRVCKVGSQGGLKATEML